MSLWAPPPEVAQGPSVRASALSQTFSSSSAPLWFGAQPCLERSLFPTVISLRARGSGPILQGGVANGGSAGASAGQGSDRAHPAWVKNHESLPPPPHLHSGLREAAGVGRVRPEVAATPGPEMSRMYTLVLRGSASQLVPFPPGSCSPDKGAPPEAPGQGSRGRRAP